MILDKFQYVTKSLTWIWRFLFKDIGWVPVLNKVNVYYYRFVQLLHAYSQYSILTVNTHSHWIYCYWWEFPLFKFKPVTSKSSLGVLLFDVKHFLVPCVGQGSPCNKYSEIYSTFKLPSLTQIFLQLVMHATQKIASKSILRTTLNYMHLRVWLITISTIMCTVVAFLSSLNTIFTPSGNILTNIFKVCQGSNVIWDFSNALWIQLLLISWSELHNILAPDKLGRLEMILKETSTSVNW